MTEYTLTVEPNELSTTVTRVEQSVTVEKNEFTLSLSRTGGQGSKGDSVTNAVINSDADLIITITRADGTSYEVNAGNLEANIDLDDLNAFSIQNSAEGDILIWNNTEQQFENHQFTTSNAADIDNTNKANGATLVYESSTQKYTATNRMQNADTHIIGGNF